MPSPWWDKIFKNTFDSIPNSYQGPQGFAQQLTVQAEPQRPDWPQSGAVGNRCSMCHESPHFLNSCPILLEYTKLGKVARNAQTWSYSAMEIPFLLTWQIVHGWPKSMNIMHRTRISLSNLLHMSRQTSQPICSKSKGKAQLQMKNPVIFPLHGVASMWPGSECVILKDYPNVHQNN